MGCGLSKDDMNLIRSHTGMTNKEIKQSYRDFKKEAGGDKLKLDKFTKLVKEMNTNEGQAFISSVFVYIYKHICLYRHDVRILSTA